MTSRLRKTGQHGLPSRNTSENTGSALRAYSRGQVTTALAALALMLSAATSSRAFAQTAATAAPTAGASISKPDSEPNPRLVQPERPTVATHAGTVAPGYVEIEAGIERDRYTPHDLATQVPTVIKIGIVPRVQLSLNVPLSSASDVSFGVGDVAIGVKWRVLEDHPIFSDIAIQPAVKFSTGNARGTGTTDASILFIDSYKFGPVAVDLNAGITRRSGDGTTAPRTATVWTASSGYTSRGGLGFVLELYGYPGTSGPPGSAGTVAVLLGPTYLVRPELNLDAGIIEPVAGAQPRAFYAGVVANLGKLPFGRK